MIPNPYSNTAMLLGVSAGGRREQFQRPSVVTSVSKFMSCPNTTRRPLLDTLRSSPASLSYVPDQGHNSSQGKSVGTLAGVSSFSSSSIYYNIDIKTVFPMRPVENLHPLSFFLGIRMYVLYVHLYYYYYYYYSFIDSSSSSSRNVIDEEFLRRQNRSPTRGLYARKQHGEF